MAADSSKLGHQTLNHPLSWSERMQTVITTIGQPSCENVEKYLLPSSDPEIVEALASRRPCTTSPDPDSKWSDKHVEVFAAERIAWPCEVSPEVEARELTVHRCPGTHLMEHDRPSLEYRFV